LARLVQLLIDQTQAPSTLGRAVTEHAWLFPGRRPGTHKHAAGFSDVLNTHGIEVRPSRTAALLNLAEHLPAAILADAIGMNTRTALRWSKLVQRDWTDYLAIRNEEVNNSQPIIAASRVTVRGHND